MLTASKHKESIRKIHAKVKGSILRVEDDPFLRSEIDRTPGFSLVPSKGGLLSIVDSVKGLWNGAHVCNPGGLPSSSLNGLGFNSNNLLMLKSRMQALLMGLEWVEDTIKDYDVMLSKTTGKRFALFDFTKGEKLLIASKMRWDAEGNWDWQVRKKMFAEIDKHKELQLLTLTFDPSLVEKDIPDWWPPPLGLKEWLVMAAWYYLNDFLKRLRKYREREVHQRWNYLGAVMEFQENGNVHFHLVFFGPWIAPISELKRMWGGSHQDAGVDITKRSKHRNHKSIKAYLTKYLTKSLSSLDRPEWKRCCALMWRYKVRLYNLRHTMMLKEVRGKGYANKKEFDRLNRNSPWMFLGTSHGDMSDEMWETKIDAGWDFILNEYRKGMAENGGSIPYVYDGDSYSDEPDEDE